MYYNKWNNILNTSAKKKRREKRSMYMVPHVESFFVLVTDESIFAHYSCEILLRYFLSLK